MMEGVMRRATIEREDQKMTVDQRLESLLQSTESLHATVQQMTGQIQEHTKQLELDAANIRSLANIAAAHQTRIEALQNGKQS